MIAGLKTYLDYKDSGGEWLGEVPEQWQIVRSKRSLRAAQRLRVRGRGGAPTQW